MRIPLSIALIAAAAATLLHHAGGYWLLTRGYRLAGVALLIIYGCYGLDGLVHYALAPASAHSAAMKPFDLARSGSRIGAAGRSLPTEV